MSYITVYLAAALRAMGVLAYYPLHTNCLAPCLEHEGAQILDT